jgi:hypothetical protein
MVVQVGFWNDVSGVDLADVDAYRHWSEFITANHALPVEETWQYPPGAGFLMLIPRLGGDFGKSFIALMLLLYLAGTVLLAALAERERRDAGVWAWLLAMPLLATLPVLRFDLVPTVLAMGALLVIHRRPAWFGALAGIGAMIKVWPAVVLFGEWDRRRLLVSGGAAAAVAVVGFVVAATVLAHPFDFLSAQEDRGLQIEAVATAPWYLREMVTGEPPHVVGRYGSHDIASGPADTVATLLSFASLAVLLAAAWWWLARSRAIRRGRADLAEAAVSRDFVFAIVLGLVVTSRVLSPQFMIWLLGVAAVILTAGTGRLARPAWIVVGAVILTAGLYESPANFVLRNTALLVAAVDAGIAMTVMVRGGRLAKSEELAPQPAATGPG